MNFQDAADRFGNSGAGTDDFKRLYKDMFELMGRDTANADAASLAKAVLTLEHRTLPPTAGEWLVHPARLCHGAACRCSPPPSHRHRSFVPSPFQGLPSVVVSS